MKLVKSFPVENTVGKGEIAHYEQFLLFPQCFQETCTHKKKELEMERVNSLTSILIFQVHGIELKLNLNLIMVYPIRSCVNFKFTKSRKKKNPRNVLGPVW